MSKWNYMKASRSKNRRIRYKGLMALMMVNLLRNSKGRHAYFVRKYRAALAYRETLQ